MEPTRYLGLDVHKRKISYCVKDNFPLLTGEVAFMLWLVIRGAIPKPVVAPSFSPAGN